MVRELDELQDKAAEANHLRQKLKSAEDKAERRKKRLECTENAIRQRNELLKIRGKRIDELTSEVADLRKQVPSERERKILDMWPKFEDGEPVMTGDKAHCASTHNDKTEIEVESITVMDGLFVLCDDECRSSQYEQGQRVKRPVQSVLDADGVEIKAGDTVWDIKDPHGFEMIVDRIELNALGHVRTLCEKPSPSSLSIHPNRLTHTRPDSWERLEQDALNFARDNQLPHSVDQMERDALDIIRRAKALAGVEAGE